MTSPKAIAVSMVNSFRTKGGNGAWTGIPRKDYADELEERVRTPEKIDQAQNLLCGPAAFTYALARTQPTEYVRFATELYDLGKSALGTFAVKPEGALLSTDVPTAETNIGAVDWVTMASLRSASNLLFWVTRSWNPFADVGHLSTPGDLEKWFNALGFKHVLNDASLLFTKPLTSAQEASRRFTKGHNVCLLIHWANLKSGSTGTSFIPTHWFTLESALTVSGNVQFKIWHWAITNPMDSNRNIDVPLDCFLKQFYGFISAGDADLT
jgi:hypothetical protein